MKDKLTGVTVMEKRKGWGASVPEEWRNADWQYASFTPDGKPNEKANAGIKACFVCHKPHEKQDFVISLAQLAGKFPSGPVALKSGMHDVNINGFAFGPGSMKVAAGQPVTWTNGDDSPHQITVAGQAAAHRGAAERAEHVAHVRRAGHVRLHLRAAPGDERHGRGDPITD